MSEKKSSAEETKLMLFFGRVPEHYIRSLEAYPFIFFNSVSEAKLEYSVETKDKTKPTVFIYDLTLNLDSNDLLPKRYAALEEAVRKLFWREVKIEVKINGKEGYKSE